MFLWATLILGWLITGGGIIFALVVSDWSSNEKRKREREQEKAHPCPLISDTGEKLCKEIELKEELYKKEQERMWERIKAHEANLKQRKQEEPSLNQQDLKSWLFENQDLIREITSESGEYTVSAASLGQLRKEFEDFCYKQQNVAEINEDAEGNVVVITF